MTPEIWEEIRQTENKIKKVLDNLAFLKNKITKIYRENVSCDSCRNYYEIDKIYDDKKKSKYKTSTPCEYCIKNYHNDGYTDRLYDYISPEEIEAQKPTWEKLEEATVIFRKKRDIFKGDD